MIGEPTIGQPIRVLIVDDDREDAELVQDLLAEVSNGGPAVTVATSYDEGLSLIRKRSADVCLLDYRLGARTGIDFLRESDVVGSGIPVVLLTGQGTREIDDQALRAGAVDFLSKQEITASSLGRAVRYAVERARRRRAEARLRALQANSRELISVLAPDGTLLHASPAISRILGLPTEDMVGVNTLGEVHPDDRAHVEAELRRVVADETHVARLQYRVRHSDGSWRVLDTWAENYLHDPHIQGIVVGSWDVTEHVAQAERIRFQATLLEAVGQAVIATDTDGMITYWNWAAEVLYGWTREEALGRSILEVTPSDASRERAAEILAGLAEGETWTGELTVRRKDGTTFLALISNAPIRDRNGALRGIVGVSSDITHIKRIERDLIERVKELKLLVRAGEILNRLDRPLRERLQLIAEAIPSGWLRPEATEARLTVDSEVFATDGFEETPWMLDVAIPSARGELGRIEVALTSPPPDGDGGPFLPEEGELVQTLARTVGEAIDRDRLTRQIAQTVSSLSEAVLVIDSRGGRRVVRDVNPATERIFGWSRQELVGDTTEKIHVDREHSERFGAAMFAALAAGDVFEATFPFRRKDGTVFEAEQTVTLLDPEEGLEGGLVGAVRDVSARLRAEAALRRSEERFSVLIREISDLICIVETDGTVLFCSPSVEAVTGYTAERLQGMNVLDIVHPEDRPSLEELLSNAPASENRTLTVNHRIITKGGELRHIESVARNLLDHPEIGGIVLSSRDVTERTLFEERLQLNQRLEAVGRLAGGIAHDFNNVLTVIRSQADLTLSEISDPRVTEEISLIRAAADRAATLTSQLLAFSREQVLRPRIVDLGGLLLGMGRMLERIIGEHIEISYDLSPTAPPVQVDPAQLEQVVMNLVVNARDAMPAGGRLTLAVHEEVLDAGQAEILPGLEPGRYTTLSVSDTGVGMSPETLVRVFEPFFTTKERGKGTGLGLAMAYGVMKQSGGGIHAESRLGAGTTFRLRFPASLQEAESLEDRRRPSEPPRARAGSGQVLVVEDDHAVRRITQKILERAGFTVAAAEDAERALELLETLDPVDVVLTDLVLPGMSGKSLVGHLRKTRPHIPIVVASGYDNESPGERGDLPREVAFLQKPFTTEALVAAISDAIAGR